MIYKVIGLMSGSSLDGLDIAYVHLDETRGKWSYQILHAECLPYDHAWKQSLLHASRLEVPEFLRLHTEYGRYTGQLVRSFMERYNLEHRTDFIASHGHTAFHDPAHRTSFQLGDGASLSAATGKPVISDLRNMDIAMGGQGAPIVPVGDEYLFPQFSYLLNLGGIANLTVRNEGSIVAFDVCPANRVMNMLAEKEGMEFDRDGSLAQSGDMLGDCLSLLNQRPYYAQPAPKSLSNEQAINMIFPPLLESTHDTADMLHTLVAHIARQVSDAVARYPVTGEKNMLVTGGGAHNTYLIAQLQRALQPYGVTVTIPDEMTVNYKEALVMALIGTLRWREERNVFSSVTGASADSIGGALWMV